MRAGVGEHRVRLTNAISSRDQRPSGPSGVEAQSKPRMRCVISPLPTIFAAADDEPPNSVDATFASPASLIPCGLRRLHRQRTVPGEIRGIDRPFRVESMCFGLARFWVPPLSKAVMHDLPQVMPRGQAMTKAGPGEAVTSELRAGDGGRSNQSSHPSITGPAQEKRDN